MKAGARTEAAHIHTDVLRTLIKARTPMVILDARTGKYDDGRRIPGAKSLSPTAKPEEVAALALFLASDQSSGITGQTINCCCGLEMD